MPTADPIAVVDAAVADLEATPGLAAHTTRRYARPTVIPPDVAPLLAVWVASTDYRLEVTPDGYERTHSLHVGWWEFDADAADTGGTGDAAVMVTLAGIVESLSARMRPWAGGLPTMAPDVVATLHRADFRATEGTLWEAEITLDVMSLAGW